MTNGNTLKRDLEKINNNSYKSFENIFLNALHLCSSKIKNAKI